MASSRIVRRRRLACSIAATTLRRDLEISRTGRIKWLVGYDRHARKYNHENDYLESLITSPRELGVLNAPRDRLEIG
eukprot:2871715-Pleurochrysis_carterae.AAC.1